MLKKFFKRIYSFNNKLFPSHNIANCKESYSQCGEDLLVQYIFNLRGISKPSYIDIGANDPFFLNNTAIFYSNGSRGVNIEANPHLMQRFYDLRQYDINLNVGIGENDQISEFYIMNDPTLVHFQKKNVINTLKRVNIK